MCRACRGGAECCEQVREKHKLHMSLRSSFIFNVTQYPTVGVDSRVLAGAAGHTDQDRQPQRVPRRTQRNKRKNQA